ncbi:alpha/beta hydrolase domain-containing protein [Streptomyces sp. GQFP]|uniref:alpha/beta hydrolase domain-containing protein n=1 Tax=Streptomyces sp. GQFP TaxID=2907545 RepID=UPI001F43FDC0|nr:alpha/beta hydrolase domain-containing protein [Streptomyces sp. GQFP]UIX28599.1 hypothetical protein LUX31_00345 [Streptomyces sp. GQFP]
MTLQPTKANFATSIPVAAGLYDDLNRWAYPTVARMLGISTIPYDLLASAPYTSSRLFQETAPKAGLTPFKVPLPIDWSYARGELTGQYEHIGLGTINDGSGTAGLQGLKAMLSPPTRTGCGSPINTGQAHYVLDTAEFALNRWVKTGIPPAKAPRLQVDTSGSAPAFVLDTHGNVVGGVRTPSVEAPVAVLSGLGQTGASFCFLFGTTTPFSAEKPATLYPDHATFVAKDGRDRTRGRRGFHPPGRRG